MEESREESMIFDVYFPATVHAANTARELIVSRDMKKVPTRLVGNVTVRWSITRDLYIAELSRMPAWPESIVGT